MKLHVHFQLTSDPWGGGNSFLQGLVDWLSRQPSIELVGNLEDPCDVCLVNGGSAGPGIPLDLALIRRRRSWWRTLGHPVRMVYRIDGFKKIYAGIEADSDRCQLQMLRLADHVVFQSDYCKQSADQMGGGYRESSIIPNAVDLKRYPFALAPNHTGPLKIMMASWSSNPNKGHRDFIRLAQLPGVECHFYGQWCPDVEPIGVQVHQSVSNVEMPQIYAQHDVVFCPSRYEACSNVFIEAQCACRPVIYALSGSHPEIAGPGCFPIPEPWDQAKMTDLLEWVRRHRNQVQQDMFKARERWSIENVGGKYLKVFEQVLGTS